MFNTLKVSLGGLFLALFLIPSFAHSSTYYQVDEDEAVGYGSSYSSAVADWCSKINGTCAEQTFSSIYSPGIEKWTVSRTGGGYSNNSVLSKTKSGACPSGLEDDGNGLCVEQPQCSQGSTFQLAFETTLGQTSVTIGGNPMPLVDNGCVYLPSDPLSNDVCSLYDDESNPSGPPVLVCSGSYTATGEVYTGDTSDTIQSVDPSTYTQHVDEQPTSTTTNTPVTTDSLPDGTTVETESSSTTTKGATDTSVTSDSDTTTVTHNGSSSSTSTQTTTTTTNPDGSSEVNKETQNSYTSPQTSTTSIDNHTGQSSGTSTGGGTSNSGSTVSDTYDSNGTHTGTTTSGSGNGTGTDDSTKEGNCGAPGQPPCDVTLDDNSDEYANDTAKISTLESELQQQQDEFTQSLSDTDEDYGASQIQDFDPDSWVNKYSLFPSSGTCSGEINTTIFGHTFLLSPCAKLQPLRDILAWVFFILTFFTITRIVFDRKIF